MTSTSTMLKDYNGIAQSEALPVLEAKGAEVFDLDVTMGAAKVTIGRILNDIAANGLAIAAYDDIESDDAKSKRTWTPKGRETSVSRFRDEYLPNTDRRKVSDWRKMATDFDTLEAAGVPTDGFAPSAFLALDTKADDDTFVTTVKDAVKANDGTLTAKQFVEAGREAGIVPAARGSKTKTKVTGVAAKRMPVIEPANKLLVAARDAIESGQGFTKGQREMFADLADLLTVMSEG